MFTKFNEYEMQDFFEKEPLYIGEYEEGNWIYTIEENFFKLVLVMDTYEAVVELSISHYNEIVYRGIYKNVEEIRKSDDKSIRVIIAKEKSIVLKKGKQIGIIMEAE